MKVEITCLGCGMASAISVEKTLPLCEKCIKASRAASRGVTRKKKSSKSAPKPNTSKATP